MIVKLLVTLLVFYNNVGVNGYKYSNLAGGWLKLYKPLSWDDADVKCEFEGGVLASPINSQVRDAIAGYLKQSGNSGIAIMSGVKADMANGDYVSREGVSLNKMPVIAKKPESDNNANSESCMKWMSSQAEVQIVNCDDKLPFVCYKRRDSVEVAGCGTRDLGYAYDARSGSCYKSHTDKLNWAKANKRCKKEGSYLAIINNQLESIVLSELLQKVGGGHTYALMGFRDWKDGKSWMTIEGETLAQAGFNTWAAGEPNNNGPKGLENCGSIYKDGKYNDISCTTPDIFICEKNPEILTHPINY